MWEAALKPNHHKIIKESLIQQLSNSVQLMSRCRVSVSVFVPEGLSPKNSYNPDPIGGETTEEKENHKFSGV